MQALQLVGLEALGRTMQWIPTRADTLLRHRHQEADLFPTLSLL